MDYRAARGLDRSLFLRLSACGWVREHRHLIITGPAGVGKSWLGTFGTWSNAQLLPRISVKADVNAFHSLRHNFEQMLSDAGLSDHIQIRLLGHRSESEGTRARYLQNQLAADQMKQFLAMDVGTEIDHLLDLRTF